MLSLGDSNLDWMVQLKHLNLACNLLKFSEVFYYLVSQAALSNLVTLILDNMYQITLSYDTFCSVTFSRSLQRLSLQMVDKFEYDVTSLLCLPNLRSLSIGHNRYFYPLCGNTLCDIFAILNRVSYVDFVRLSYLMSYEPIAYGLCYSISDKSMDDYFIDESIVNSPASNGSSLAGDSTIDMERQFLRCTRVIGADHITANVGYIVRTINDDLYFDDTFNRLEMIDFSHGLLAPNGLRYSNGALRGLKKLRRIDLSYLNVIFIHNYTFTDSENIEYFDVSGNIWGDMDANYLSLMLSKPMFMKIVNFSSCSIVELNEDFLWQFPKLRYLDLSNNKLSEMNLNLSLSFPDVIGLNISKNNLIALKVSFTSQLDNRAAANKSVVINMNDNPFRCNCDSLSFIRWFISTRVTIENKLTISCSYQTAKLRIVDVLKYTDLSNECELLDLSTRLIKITISVGIGLILIGIICGVILFKYRWHIRWRWYVTKRLLRKNSQVKSDDQKKEFVCFISYLGINGEGTIREFINQIESMSGKTTLLYEKNAMPGGSRDGFITEAIIRSKKLLFAIGSCRPKRTEDIAWFEFTIRMACIDRTLKMSDIIIYFWDKIPYENIDVSLLKWLCKPGSRSGVTLVQQEGNAMVWEELKEALQLSETRPMRQIWNSEEIVVI